MYGVVVSSTPPCGNS